MLLVEWDFIMRMRDTNMEERTRYYRFIAGSVTLRRLGDKIEKRGVNGVWEDACDLAWRFISPDGGLIEISEADALDRA